ncbi:MAG: orotidine-5'-phosphate decarboxylase [Actinomycetes bacterium]|jgi:orotidine-5'-phosphate decarboxylase
MVSPVLVALDVPRLDDALAIARRVAPHVGGFKVGLELMMAEGPRAVAAVADLGLPVFADAKLHDIPNTVAGAARALGRHGARWVTLHPGGRAMVRAGVEALAEGAGGREAGVLVVTVLTSLDQGDLDDIGISRPVSEQVQAMAALAADCGAEGVVCSPAEIASARRGGPGLTVVTPGIRPAGSGGDDQKRVATPARARAAGADWLVIGRPITAAPDPADAAARIAAELAQ